MRRFITIRLLRHTQTHTHVCRGCSSNRAKEIFKVGATKYIVSTFAFTLMPFSLLESIHPHEHSAYTWKFMVKVCAASCKSTDIFSAFFLSIAFSFLSLLDWQRRSCERSVLSSVWVVHWNQFAHCTYIQWLTFAKSIRFLFAIFSIKYNGIYRKNMLLQSYWSLPPTHLMVQV